MPLQRVGTNLMSGLMETLAGPPYNGRADLPALAGVPAIRGRRAAAAGRDAAVAALRGAGGRRHPADRRRAAQFVDADTEERKRIFAAALRAHVPLVNMIRQVLDERWNHRASAVRFRDELEDHMSPDYAEDTLRTVIGWGRYAELFSYDEEAEQFSLEDIE